MNIAQQLLCLAILLLGMACGRARVVDDPVDAGADVNVGVDAPDAADAPTDTSDD